MDYYLSWRCVIMEKGKIKYRIVKLLLFFAAGGVLLVVLFLVINLHVRSSVKDRILTPEEAATVKADCILILGAGVWDNGQPSQMLQDRLMQGIDLYLAGVSDRILMSGDHGRKSYDEVNTMKDYAIARDIPSEHIFMDHAGFSTYESMYRARDIFKAKKVVIVTQRYHMYRALYIASRLGLDAYGVASDPGKYAGQDYRDLRETAARVKDYFLCVAKPEPTYLGDAIPVSGNGDATND
jgi:vancomycin permeability regulator SanA